MGQHSTAGAGQVVIGPDGLNDLVSLLRADGYQVLAPVVRGKALVIEPIASAMDLPRGVGDSQDGGRYRLVERGDDAFFGFATPAGTWKRYLFPPRSVLWRARRDGDSITVEDADDQVSRRAFFGIRGCDLAAIATQDRIFLSGARPDPVYAARREGIFVVGVNCSDPAATCFCASMNTGPRIDGGADLILTELDPGDPARHRFLLDLRTQRGRAVAERLDASSAVAGDERAARQVTESACSRMGRQLDTRDLPQLLMDSLDHPRWDDVADRCLACGNCTLACPTCFCADISDQVDLVSGTDERVREWGSCFTLSHSYLNGGSVRSTTRSRYRQWLTHKLSTWWEQWDTSGCTGCGRCITWCPVGIDITEEVRAIRGNDAGAGGAAR